MKSAEPKNTDFLSSLLIDIVLSILFYFFIRLAIPELYLLINFLFDVNASQLFELSYHVKFLTLLFFLVLFIKDLLLFLLRPMHRNSDASKPETPDHSAELDSK